ncbi:MAG: hypothetical protein HYX29_06585 [Solirubrobacterales bacterium]|nr:hypothetical protein [Solirubrobacterales bacterium]
MRTALFASMLATLVLATTASANEYVVYSCKTPSGAPAPTDGWSATGGASFGWAVDRCGSGGSLGAGMGGPSQPANVASIGWGFDSGAAPIRSYKIDRSGRVSGGGFGVSMFMFTANAQNDPNGGRQVDYCAAHLACQSISGSVTRDGASIPGGSRSWFFTMACGGYAGELCTHPGSPDFGQVNVNSAAFTLEDDEQPSFAAVGGSLTADGASFGTIGFMASDDVSGIARATIEVDGSELVSIVPNANGGRCNRLGQAGATNDYLYRRPCPARQQVELTLPRNTLINGEHTIRARAYDAAGNSVTAFGPRRIQVTGSLVTGLSAAKISADGSTDMVANYGRSVRINGTLRTNTGEPIAGARIESTFDSSAATRSRIGRAVHTDADGRFSISIRALANRTWALTNQDTGAKLTGKLKVRSRIALRTSRKRVRAFGKMRLTGGISSERAKNGASVAIKVKNGRRWRTVAVVRATRAGNFKFNYRFTRVSRTSLRFRAVALKSSDLTVAASPSRSVTIRVG